MSGIVLSSGVRSNLLQLQQTGEMIGLTQTRLATGKRVNSALDNPTNYFTAQALQSRASDLSNLLDSQSSAIKTIEAANNGISAITKLVQSAQATARQAQQTADVAERTDLAAQFDSILAQIDLLAGDAGFNGKNLLAGDTLSVVFNENGDSLDVVGFDDTVANDLDVTAATGGWDSATLAVADAAVAASLTELTASLTALRSQSKSLGSSLSTVQARTDFTKATINTLQTGADNLTLADTNEEGANLLALQTRQQLSTTALSIAAQADQNVLRLFR